MKRKSAFVAALLIVFCFAFASNSYSQGLHGDGKFGLSIFSGQGSSTAFLFGGAMDIPIGDRQGLYFRPEFNITTHPSTPIEACGILKYNLPTSMQQTIYIDGGLGFWFMTGGPFFGLDFGGGMLFPLQNSSVQIPVEIRLGPIIATGSSIFQIALTTGVHF